MSLRAGSCSFFAVSILFDVPQFVKQKKKKTNNKAVISLIFIFLSPHVKNSIISFLKMNNFHHF
jgi:hypothetical protein